MMNVSLALGVLLTAFDFDPARPKVIIESGIFPSVYYVLRGMLPPGTELEIVHFTPSPGEAHRRDLTEAAEYCQAHGFTVKTTVREASPRVGILAHAQETDADLIVMGKVGRKGHRRSLLGSVTERVLEAADLPVFVVSPP